MYGFKHLKLLLNDPKRLLVELNRLYHRRLYTARHNPDGINFLDEEWDNLVILDACRYDIFKEVCDLPGETQSRISLGSTTKEFVRATFSERQLYDVVYVSANVWYERLRDKINSDIFRFIATERDAGSGSTSHPETVTSAAIDAYREHPRKRLIVHYLQPHGPYIGDIGSKVSEKGIPREQLSKDLLREVYVENLQLALANVQRLLDEIPGRTVITGDHGEMLGDPLGPIPMRSYSHPIGIYTDELVKVPWHVVEKGRRDIVAAKKPFSEERRDERVVKEQLRDLGYVV